MRAAAAGRRLATTRSFIPAPLLARLSRPVRPATILLGWIGATLIFLLVATALGGPTEGDSAEVVYGTWAIAHGHLACVYPVSRNVPSFVLANPFALAAPLYPILTGALAALLRVGHLSPFPSARVLGPSCAHGFTALYRWSTASAAILPTVRLGYVTWLILLAGVAATVRATRARNTGFEVLAGPLVALVPPVVMCLTYYFHPQDLLAEGLILLAVGAFLRRRWALCGALCGLALTSQQFAILAVVVLVILAEREALVKVVGSMVAALAVVDGPFILVSGERALRTALLGSSRVGSDIVSHGGTVLFATGATGVVAFFASRIAPVVAAAALALWGRRRRARPPTPELVVGLVAGALVARLIFEINLFGYYFMATVVTLVVLEMVRGDLGRDVVALGGLLLVGMNPEHVAFISNLTTYGLTLFNDLPIVVGALGVVVLLYDTVRRRTLALADLVWVGFVALAGESHLWHRYNPVWSLPTWAWQVVLVGYLAVILARRLAATTRLDEGNGVGRHLVDGVVPGP